MNFTALGTPEAESRVRRDLERILATVGERLPGDSVIAVALTGGFGRGEGGMIRNAAGGLSAFNDYDLAIVTRGPLDPSVLKREAPRLARELDVDFVDFGVFQAEALPRVPRTVFWYELREGHRVLAGEPKALLAIPPIDPADLPPIEATRLLLNRGLSLLWAWLHLDLALEASAAPDPGHHRFIVNSIHKAVLAIGDAALIRSGRYHLSYPERNRRLGDVELPFQGAETQEFMAAHDRATTFKLHPAIGAVPVGDLVARWRTVRRWHEIAFRWIEEFRLGRPIGRWSDYPGRLAVRALSEGFRHPRRYLRERGAGSALRGWSRYVLDVERAWLARLPFLLYSAGPDGPDRDLLCSGLRAGNPAPDRSVRDLWRAASAELLAEWHP